MTFLYFTAEYAIKTHDKIIEISGGISGIKDFGNIESPLEHIKNDYYYPELEDKITHLVFLLIKIMLSLTVIRGPQLH
jgi:death on curing protein